MGMGTNSTSQPVYTPRGAIHVQASQIEQEIDELKKVIEKQETELKSFDSNGFQSINQPSSNLKKLNLSDSFPFFMFSKF